MPPSPIVLTFLRQRYDFVEAGCRTKIGDKEERQEQDQGQVQSQICEEEGAQEQSPGPRQGHPERCKGGEGDSVSVVTLPAPPVSMTTTTAVNNNTNIIVPLPLQQQMNDTSNLLDVGSDNSDDDDGVGRCG